MANTGIQLIGYVLAFIALVGLITCTWMPDWTSNSYASGDVMTAHETNIGLWMKCNKGSTGLVSCESLGSLLYITVELQVTRAMMIVSIVLSGSAVFVAMVGMKCTKCLEEDKELKKKVAFAGGILFILAGLCAFTVVSCYASGVYTSFHDNPLLKNRFDFGSALYVGWSSALLSVVGGTLLCCCSTQCKKSATYPSKGPMAMNQGTCYV